MSDTLDAYALDVLLLLALGWWLVWSLRTPRARRVDSDPKLLRRAVDTLMAGPASPGTVVLPKTAAAQPSPVLEYGLAEIRSRDPRFDPAFFLTSVRDMYAPVMAAYASGDRTALARHVSRDVLEAFSARIDARERCDGGDEMRLVSIGQPQMLDAGVTAGSAWVVVRCTSRIAAAVCDSADAGSSRLVQDVADAWVFARDIGAPRTTWKLIAVSADGAGPAP